MDSALVLPAVSKGTIKHHMEIKSMLASHHSYEYDSLLPFVWTQLYSCWVSRHFISLLISLMSL